MLFLFLCRFNGYPSLSKPFGDFLYRVLLLVRELGIVDVQRRLALELGGTFCIGEFKFR